MPGCSGFQAHQLLGGSVTETHLSHQASVFVARKTTHNVANSSLKRRQNLVSFCINVKEMFKNIQSSLIMTEYIYDFSLTILYIHYIPNNIKALFRNFSTKKGFIQL